MDEKFIEILLQAMHQNNQHGYDYLEYKKAIQSLIDILPDEKTRYQSAYAIAKTNGVNLINLEKSAEKYQQILKSEEAKFVDAANHQINVKLKQREDACQLLSKNIEEKKSQIAYLEKMIHKDMEDITRLKMEIEDSSNKLTNTKNSFYASYQHIMLQIDEDIKKLKSYVVE